MKYHLVLQFPGKAESDFEELLDVETQLETGLKGMADVDGHDFGSGEMNLFIITDSPEKVFNLAKQLLEGNKLFNSMKAAYRAANGNDYTLLWPKTLGSFRVK